MSNPLTPERQEMAGILLEETTAGIKSGQDAGPLEQILEEANGDLRVVKAETALGLLASVDTKRNDPQLFSALRYLQHHPSAHLRSKIALLEGQANPDVSHVRSLMATQDGRLRANAVESLWGRSTPDVLALFREASHDKVSRVAINALVGLCRAGDRGAYALLRNWSQSPDPARRAGALWALGAVGERLSWDTANQDPVLLSHDEASSQVARAEYEPALAGFEDAGTALVGATLGVLEEMCFVSGVELPGRARISAPYLTAQVEFRGHLAAGRCLAEMTEALARMLAANFNGILDPESIGIRSVIEVVCEFVNMVCGGTLGRIDLPGIVTLAPPHLLWDWPALLENRSSETATIAVERWLDIEGQAMRLGFEGELPV